MTKWLVISLQGYTSLHRETITKRIYFDFNSSVIFRYVSRILVKNVFFCIYFQSRKKSKALGERFDQLEGFGRHPRFKDVGDHRPEFHFLQSITTYQVSIFSMSTSQPASSIIQVHPDDANDVKYHFIMHYFLSFSLLTTADTLFLRFP